MTKTSRTRPQIAIPSWLGRREKADVQRVVNGNMAHGYEPTAREIDRLSDLISHRHRISAMQKALLALARCEKPDSQQLAAICGEINRTAEAARGIADEINLWAAEGA